MKKVWCVVDTFGPHIMLRSAYMVDDGGRVINERDQLVNTGSHETADEMFENFGTWQVCEYNDASERRR